jgi:hypothetical protein
MMGVQLVYLEEGIRRILAQNSKPIILELENITAHARLLTGMGLQHLITNSDIPVPACLSYAVLWIRMGKSI